MIEAAPVAAVRAPEQRSPLRAVAVPAEHGGWGLTVEPALLGLLVAQSVAGGLLAAAAVVAFLARTPLRVVLVDRRRHRALDRTALAARVLAAEVALLAALAAGATLLGDPRWWWAAVAAAPLVLVELWFDLRSRSRRLVPELAGAAGISASAAAIVLASGGTMALAIAVWLVPAARVVTSIPHVRDQIARLHGRSPAHRTNLLPDAAAGTLALVAVALDPSVLLGALAIGGVVVVQRLGARRPVPPPKVLGLRQMALGLAVVAACALGVHLT